MFALEVFHNGTKVSTAGVGRYGVLSAGISWVSHEPEKLAEWAKEGEQVKSPSITLNVGGISVERLAHVDWPMPEVKLGDEVIVRLREVNEVDEPKLEHSLEPDSKGVDQKEYVRRMAKELGWQVIENPAPA